MSFLETAAHLFRKATDFQSTFFGPGEPPGVEVAESVTADAPVREFDYPDGWNQYVGMPNRTKVSAVTGTSFAALRNTANSIWQIRLVVEHCKDEIEAKPWRLALRREDGEPETSYVERSDRQRGRLTSLTERFEKPDGTRPWASWIRTLIEEMLVLDAPTIYNWDDDLIILDGSTIEPLLDEAGRVPREGPAYEQWIHGSKYGEWSKEELIYAPRNRQINKIFGFPPVEQILSVAILAANRTGSQILRNSDGNLPPALLEAPEKWGAKELREFQEFFDAAMASPERRTRITYIPNGSKPFFPGQEFLLKDEFDEWIARAVAYAFGVSPNIFIRQQNRASAEQYEAESAQRGEGSRKRWVKLVVDTILKEWYDATDFEFVWDDEEPLDDRQRAEVDEIDLRSGVVTINEARENRGLPPIEEEDEDEDDENGENPAEMDEDDENEEDGVVSIDRKRKAKEKAILSRFSKQTPVPAGWVVSSSKTTIWEAEVDKLTDMIAIFLQAEGNRIAVTIDTVSKAEDPIMYFDAGLIFDWDEFAGPLAGAIDPVYLSGYAAGASEIGAAMASLVFPSELATEWAQKHAADLVVQIESSTRAWVRGLVRTALTDGWAPGRLASEISQHWAFSRDRANVIARTELAFAQTNGTIQAWKDSGLVKSKRWVLGPDSHRKPDDCDLNAGVVVRIGKSFPSGHEAPPLHPNCRCVVTAVVQPPEK